MDTSEASFGEALSTAAIRVERMLETCLPPAEGGRGEAELAAAMRHAVLDGGKRMAIGNGFAPGGKIRLHTQS